MVEPQDVQAETVDTQDIKLTMKSEKVSGAKTHGGQHVDNEQFLQKLGKLYANSRLYVGTLGML